MSDYTGTSTLESMSQAGFYNKWILNKFKKYLSGDILEIGCGIGSFTKILSTYGRVTAIDIDQNLVDATIKNKTNASCGLGDIEKGKYFFKTQLFDVIVCINVLEHIQNDDKALVNMKNLLREGGFLILLIPIHKFLYGEIDKNIGHYRRYDPANLTKYIKDEGFNIVSSRKLNLLGAIGWFFSGKILRNKQITDNKIKLFNLISPILYLENFIEPIIGTSVLIIAKKENK